MKPGKNSHEGTKTQRKKYLSSLWLRDFVRKNRNGKYTNVATNLGQVEDQPLQVLKHGKG